MLLHRICKTACGFTNTVEYCIRARKKGQKPEAFGAGDTVVVKGLNRQVIWSVRDGRDGAKLTA